MLNLLFKRKVKKYTFFSIIIFLLSGCINQQDTNKIAQLLDELRTQPQTQQTALLPAPARLELNYTKDNLRDPFQPSQNIADLLINTDIQREALENYTLDELSFRGVMQKGHQTYALIITPDKQLHRVTLGNKLGKNQGVIIHLDTHSIILKEYITQDNQLFKQERNIYLAN